MNKFGVPEKGKSLTKPTQPKQNYKFRIIFLGVGGDYFPDQIELTKNVVNCGLPKFNQSDLSVDVYNSRYSVLGKHSFDPIQITLRNDIANKVAYVLETQVAKQANFYDQEVAPAAGMVKFQLKIEQLDGGNRTDGSSRNPIIISTWHLTGCWINSVDWGTLDYGDSNTNNITVGIKYDNAFLSLLDFVGAGSNDQGWANSVHTNPVTSTYSVETDSAV